MREILFRGKRTDNKGWIEGLLTIMWGQYHIIKPSNENTAYPIDPKTVCQYTGLEDKNGRKIFEGDILCNHYDENFLEEETMSVIVWDRFRWGIREGEVVDGLDEFDCKNGEVAGNIFDNADLIGG